ncbi:methyl-accepting chemotaxis protein [Leptospira sp. GIMC2001]|uniref:methyl-accepting chemotaxis protein n=1 Tax=Leptospira sp. GIMC2001 TaxID=1513297 RepID=UPI00234928FA|nr:methyl-accepting chemotaxis protein [Leptospira sp. GIMC2001]WCL49298.1 methyl-accepting chemotaxis protein [Leptospira sp. GIMC2001]
MNKKFMLSKSHFSRQDQSKISIEALQEMGPVFINRIRFTLVAFYLVALLGSIHGITEIQILSYSVGISVMFSYGCMQWWMLKNHSLSSKCAKFFLFLDVTVSFAVIFSGLLGTAEAAALQIKNPILYLTIYFVLIYSAFLFSASLILYLTGYAAILLIMILVFGVSQGVELSDSPGIVEKARSASLSFEILKILFLIAAGFLINNVIKLLVRIKDEALNLKESERDKIRAENERERIRSIGEIFSWTVKEFNKAIQEFNSQLVNQAASVEEISASMEEFSASVVSSEQHIRVQYNKIDSITTESEKLEGILADVSHAAEFILERMMASRSSGELVSDSIRSLDEILREIDQSFNKVSEVNQIMSEIADRTNLLALNASIEAARAGEHGRGFAVVAQEVAKLADSSAENASQIEKIIKKAAGLIKKGSESASATSSQVTIQHSGYAELGEQIDRLTKRIREQKEINTEILTDLKAIRTVSQEIELNAREQTSTSDQVTKAIGSLDTAVSNLAANSHILQETINQLENQASSLSV